LLTIFILFRTYVGSRQNYDEL